MVSFMMGTETYWIKVFFLLNLCFGLCLGGKTDSVFWGTVRSYVILGIVFVVCAGTFSFLAWCCCTMHGKFTKRRVAATTRTAMCSDLPIWSRSLMLHPAYQNGGFTEMSEGFRLEVNRNQVLRHRSGTVRTDGARWVPGFATGKHVFEIVWPWGCRGTHATVGVCTERASLQAKGPVSLVGNCQRSWGLDIVKRRVLHNKRMTKTCPTDGSYVPDRFFMFLDMDMGMLGFGSDVTFWGFVLEGIPRGMSSKQIYVMVGSCQYMANVQVFYRGTACNNGFDIFPPPVTVAGPSGRLPPLPPGYSEHSTKGVSTAPGAPDPYSLYNEPPPPCILPTAPGNGHSTFPVGSGSYPADPFNPYPPFPDGMGSNPAAQFNQPPAYPVQAESRPHTHT